MDSIAKTKVSYDRTMSVKEIRRSVKLLTGFDLRRMDSFTLVAMQAISQLLENIELNGVTGLYGVANYFSVELLQSLVISVEQKQDVRPFDFILSVGNAANFYLAKQFSLNGPNIFLGTNNNAKENTKELIKVDSSTGLIDSAIFIHWQESNNGIQCQAELFSKNLSNI